MAGGGRIGGGGVTDEMRPIGAGLERLLRDMGMPRVFDIGRLADEWAEAAGEPFASLSEPASYRDGELVLQVTDGSAATLLKFRIGDLVTRLAERYGPGTVTTVRIRVGRGKKGL
jgi:predicted nucleic acid-binding Zn ribbon protein